MNTDADTLSSLAVQSDDLHVQPVPDVSTMLWACCGAAAVIAVVCIVCAVVLSRPRKARTPTQGAHAEGSDKRTWLARIDAVVHDHDTHRITADEAYSELAALARAFASARSGRPLATRTLRDLEHEPRTGNTDNWDALRMTIAALYPPEFADDDHPQAHSASVAQAAGWVADLVERWR